MYIHLAVVCFISKTAQDELCLELELNYALPCIAYKNINKGEGGK